MIKRLTTLFSEDKKSVDFFFAAILVVLIFFGLLIFFSASLQSLGQAKWNSLMVHQLGYSLILGGVLLFGFSHFSYKKLAQWGLFLLLGSIFMSVLVFIPGLGMSHGGGQRWIDLGFTNLQPSEFLKFSTIIFLAVWFAKWKRKMDDWKYGLLPLGAIMITVSAILYMQKDIGSLTIILLTAFLIYFVSNAPSKHIAVVMGLGVGAAICAAVFIPHVNQRVMTFLDFKDPQGAGWQVRQGLIAIGSGGVFGKGYLQSVQRFNYLPEAHGDSIFAVVGEELGFIGTTLIITLYLAFALRAFKIANRAPDDLSLYLVTGFTSMIIVQSFLNMGSVVGLIPFTGEPLVFISQGGTSLVIAMAASGIILNISRYQKNI